MDVRARCINEPMKQAAVMAIASLVKEEQLNEQHIIASALDAGVADVVAKAVGKAAIDSGVCGE
jgi:malate dehydrogenase (oxaloacetate-decarboxylating)